MRFLWPDLLWLLLFIPALVAAYLLILRRKKRVAIRYASLALVREAIGPGQVVRRHLPPALFLVAMTVAIIAIARPSATLVLPSDSMTIVLAMDVSRSMLATDIAPNRIVAAQTAARAFVKELPSSVKLGIVTFAGTAFVVQSPTENKEELIAAIDRFQLQRATATGSGMLLALSILFPDDGMDLEAAVYDNGYGFSGRAAARSLDKSRQERLEKKPFTPVPPGTYAGGGIILLSDGRRTTGPDPMEIAKMAADRGVRVFTVGFGTLEGATIPGVGGWSFYARLDEKTLKDVAQMTGGEYFHAGSESDLSKVYQSLSTKFALERKETEVSAILSLLAAMFLISAGLLSLLWFHRRG